MITEVTGDQHRTPRHDDTCSTIRPSAFSIRLMAGCQIFLNKSPSVWRGESNSLSMSFSLIPSATCQMSRASEIPRIAAAIIWLAVSKLRWPELYLTPTPQMVPSSLLPLSCCLSCSVEAPQVVLCAGEGGAVCYCHTFLINDSKQDGSCLPGGAETGNWICISTIRIPITQFNSLPWCFHEQLITFLWCLGHC